ncbi:MAG TPA: response regulator transcription factor [Clostridiaceae bacterium]|nr:response regulator transcription factor [Clostridiaceae bacterium]
MENTVLIVEDDTNINNLIKEALEQADYRCVQSFSGTEALLLAKDTNFTVIILDLMLPGLSGEELLPKIKEIQTAPVIILSAKDALDSKLRLLTSGADDYLTKPFSVEELIARVNILAKRHQNVPDSHFYQFKDLKLDSKNYTASLADQDLNLTVLELKILEILIKNPNRVFSKQDIYDLVWNDYYIGGDKTINVHISNIRKKIKLYTDEEYIETVWGIGFKLSSR